MLVEVKRELVKQDHRYLQKRFLQDAHNRLAVYIWQLPEDDDSEMLRFQVSYREIALDWAAERGIRIAGTAELNGYDRDLNRVRCEAIVRRVEQLFPGAGDTAQAQFWSGLRPATPSNVPLIGPGGIDRLYLNTGHGTLGWTLACGSGRAIADIVTGTQPEAAFPFRKPR